MADHNDAQSKGAKSAVDVDITDHTAVDKNSKGDHKNLMGLPEEIIEKILMNPDLSYKDLKRMRLTSHGLRRIADSAIEKIDRKWTSILIAGGVIDNDDDEDDDDDEDEDNTSAYIMKVTFEDQTNRITNVKYQTLPDYPIPFSNATFGSFNGRSLIMGGYESDGQCIEFDQEEYQVIPDLNINRYYAASTFIQNKVVVAGGYDRNYNRGYNLHVLDSIEILDWDESNHGSQWIQSPSRLPIKVCYHTLVTLNDKLFMIGGYDDGSNKNLDTIWEGSFDKLSNKISWVKMELRLQKKRIRHFSFVISNQIITFGGYVDDDFVEILEENQIKQGPKVPFKLNIYNDQVVLDRKNRIIITSKDLGLIVYDHQAGTFTNYNDFKLREERINYAAILQ